eukprot:CAMPEP_0201663000 /NCGR_PEP_ID=MMETSP0494-20130426/4929_1 /ASSEMBLY_ACC=CAM_ASM_000839 /TAXON_ID=420259 /ORGANISM="Thalassiosira gravida, Strain GMp14c1" /LENGTH=70 /DNA_ID=CAMNT_0048141493 /DNA_START=1074 /DNA_END=1283 /DNA_ORIENTATION=+
MKRLPKLGRKSKSSSKSNSNDDHHNHLGIGTKPSSNGNSTGVESLFNSQTSISSSVDDDDHGFSEPKQEI